MSETAKAAKAYVTRGWRPVRLHGIAADGHCTCADRLKPKHDRQAGKHPTDIGWQDQPMPTPEQIDAWYADWRSGHNVGIATGRASGFWVLDVDPDNGGKDSLKRLQADHGRLPGTVVQRTGSGGWHLLFAMPEDFEPTNRRGGLKEYQGLDVRGTGGQIVAWPSVSGKGPYEWMSDFTAEPEPAPGWLLDLVRPTATPVAEMASTPVAPAPAGDERLERYAQTVRELEVGRLQCMRDAATSDGTGYRGEPWNQTTFDVACALIELANSPWCSYTRADAQRDVAENAPRDDGFTSDDVLKCWESAQTRVGDKARAVPAERMDNVSLVEQWALDDGSIRFDPVLFKGSTPPPGAVLEVDARDEPQVPPRTWDDLGNAMRVVDHFGRTLRYVAGQQRWARYRRGRWEDVESTDVQGLIQRMFDERVMALEGPNYSAEPDDPDKPEEHDRARFKKWLKTQRMSSRIAAALREAAARPELQAKLDDFDRHPDLLNVANGVVDLRSGQLLPHDPNLMLMKQSRIAYDPTAAAPGWQAFLDRVQPNPEMQTYLQRWSGYSATGDTREQAFCIHHGEGANGKSVWQDMLMHVLDEYATTVPASVLLAGDRDQHPTGLARMNGARFLPTAETPAGRRLDEEKVKNFTGGEPVAARFMGKDFFEYVPVGKIAIITNHLPRLSDAGSIWRRSHLIQWAVTIPLPEQDRLLTKKLKDTEAEGVLAWVVRGAMAWYEQGLNPPPVAVAAVEEYRGDSDLFGQFLLERTMQALPDVKTPSDRLYQNYTDWSFLQGTKAMSRPAFVQTMKERGFSHYRDGRSRGFTGVVLATQEPRTVPLPWDES